MSHFPLYSYPLTHSPHLQEIAFSQPWQHLSPQFQCSSLVLTCCRLHLLRGHNLQYVVYVYWGLSCSNNSMSIEPAIHWLDNQLWPWFFYRLQLAWLVEVLGIDSVTKGGLFILCFDNVFCTCILFGSGLLQIIPCGFCFTHVTTLPT